MSDTPRACPNLGVDCDYPDCTFLDAECASANVMPAAERITHDPKPDHERSAAPPERALFPITADDIFGPKDR